MTRRVVDGRLVAFRQEMPDLAVILVEHEMDVIRRVSDRCVVLNFGRKIFEGSFDALIANPKSRNRLSGSRPMIAGATATRKLGNRHHRRLRPRRCAEGCHGRGQAGQGDMHPRRQRCRKETLIRSILGLNRVRKGEVYFGNDAIANMPTHKIVALGIATVPEGNRVLPRMTVLENLKVGGLLMRDSRRVAARMEELFETFSAAEGAARPVGRHVLRRRAFDAVDCARADDRSRTGGVRRAVTWICRRCSSPRYSELCGG